MNQVPACTISSNNYLALTQVMVASFKEHHPQADVYVCIVDRPDPSLNYSQMPFTTVFAEELGIPDFKHFSFRYDILELNTAVKPYLLTYLRDRYELDRIFYFDPDIMIHDRLTGLAKKTMFSKALTEYQPSYDGRNSEPVVLPAKLPVALMLGAEGIPAGRSTPTLPPTALHPQQYFVCPFILL